MTVHTAVTPSKRRRRWPWVLLVVIVLLGALAVASELVTRAIVPSIVQGQISSALNLAEGQELTAEVPGIVLPQVIAGRLDELHVTSEEATIGGITVALEGTATGVSVSTGEMASASGVARITQEEFLRVLAESDLPLEDLSFDDGVITLSGGVAVLGFTIPISVGVEAAIDDGTLLLQPTTFQIAGIAGDARALADRLGAAGTALAGPYPVCLDDRLPAGLTLTSIEVGSGSTEVDFVLDGRITVDAALQQPGTC